MKPTKADREAAAALLSPDFTIPRNPNGSFPDSAFDEGAGIIAEKMQPERERHKRLEIALERIRTGEIGAAKTIAAEALGRPEPAAATFGEGETEVAPARSHLAWHFRSAYAPLLEKQKEREEAAKVLVDFLDKASVQDLQNAHYTWRKFVRHLSTAYGWDKDNQ